MIKDFRADPDTELPAGATVIVGSGAAGLALALALGDAGLPVVVLESGGDVTEAAAAQESAHLNDGVLAGLPFDGLVNGRARLLGGTTELWHGQCMRLHDVDVRERAWVPHSGWPFGLDELAGPYAAAERFFDVSGLGYGEDRWREHAGLEPVRWDSAHLLHDFTEYTDAPYLGRVHRARLEQHPHITVLVHATAARVVLEGSEVSGAAVRGVEIVAEGGRARQVQARRVVAAAGTIENARLLMLSDPDGVGLGAGRAHTGRYLQDHPIIRTAEVTSADYRVLQDRYIVLRRGGRRLFPKVRLAPAAQEAHGLLDATAVFVHEHDDRSLEALRRLVVAARRRRRPEHPVADALLGLRAPVPVARDVYRRYAKGLATGARPSAVWLQLWLEQAPDPDSRITLDASRDAYGLRRANVHWRCSEQEMRTSRQLTRWVADDLARLGLAQVRELAPMTDDRAWLDAVGDAAHPAGTTRMATSPGQGVVDPDLAVHGVDGLYVVGGSVFPVAGYANPTLTIVALALRLAQHLQAPVGAR